MATVKKVHSACVLIHLGDGVTKGAGLSTDSVSNKNKDIANIIRNGGEVVAYGMDDKPHTVVIPSLFSD